MKSGCVSLAATADSSIVAARLVGMTKFELADSFCPNLGADMIAGFGGVMGKLALLCLLAVAPFSLAQQYDIVIEGGRVVDPETGLDAVRYVGITNGKIARITQDHLTGKRVVSAAGLVVAPGFIDLHEHGQEVASQRVKAFDGVTTALEMEIGVPDVSEFLKSKEGRSLIHYGTTASYVAARARTFGTPLPDGTILP